ncbi:MAG: RHS repeat domain-containing protein [Solirubrobacterales bacterium]
MRLLYSVAFSHFAAVVTERNEKLLILRGDVAATGFPDPVESAEIDEFGVPKTDLPADRRYGFHGSKRREALTAQGMIAMGVRLYAPRAGRFLQVDPVLGRTANPYEYPNDPVNGFDLDGRSKAPRLPFYVNNRTTRSLIRKLRRAARKPQKGAAFSSLGLGFFSSVVAAMENPKNWLKSSDFWVS